MNLQRYATLYKNFHVASMFELVRDVVVLTLGDQPWNASHILLLRFNSGVSATGLPPLVDALKAKFRTDDVCTVFRDNDVMTWTMLLGRQRIVCPDPMGKHKLCATQFFVNDPRVVEAYMKGLAQPHSENVYLHANGILYLDAHDLPYPGGRYFDAGNRAPDNELRWYRLCFLCSSDDNLPRVVDDLYSEWMHRRNVFHLNFKTSRTTVMPKFVHWQPVDEIAFPDSRVLGTGNIQHRLCLTDPRFLLQDILESLARDERNVSSQLVDVGLFIEFPFTIGFEACAATPSSRRFVALSINGGRPKRVLVVRRPYERYVEYDHVPATLWTEMWYDRSRPRKKPEDTDLVVVESTVLGYRYRDVFFCLAHPMLNTGPLYPTAATACLLSAAGDDTFHLARDRRVTVLDTYSHDCEHTLHAVRLEGIPYELWCLSRSAEAAGNFPKRVRPPHLVNHWLDFYRLNRKSAALQDLKLNVVKLCLVLARHKICFQTRIAKKNQDVIFDRNHGIVFRLEKDAVDFLNSVRLDVYRDVAQPEQGGCTIA